ncbi:XRE family transcriptional regulator [Pandoraea sputorum]|uniref:XRE family transcriptional regulator n=1 Tax=Pandoraea sputorum TaxID=93222 RepID=UPI0012585D2D|nr:XRE family transcriptional regulator [Pandoraea sputorum]VVE07052.1 hypothetical protein PSP20601_02449 [Pandoraea sputorum]
MQQSESMETQASQGVAKIDLDFSRPAKTFVPVEAINACSSYRDAVRLAWESRAHQGLTQRFLSVACALYAPHVSDYLAKDAVDSKGNRRRDLPAEKIDEFERVVGNRAVSQYLMRKAMLTIMEEVIAARAA